LGRRCGEIVEDGERIIGRFGDAQRVGSDDRAPTGPAADERERQRLTGFGKRVQDLRGGEATGQADPPQLDRRGSGGVSARR
jgi:hypothetical protein